MSESNNWNVEKGEKADRGRANCSSNQGIQGKSSFYKKVACGQTHKDEEMRHGETSGNISGKRNSKKYKVPKAGTCLDVSRTQGDSEAAIE